MRRFAASLFVLALSSAAVQAQVGAEVGAEPAGARPVAGTALFDGLHGKAGIDRIVADLLARNQADPRISDIFKASDMQRLQVQLAGQLCYLSGGGCVYDGKAMKAAHKDLGLQDTDLNALVENLQTAMDREGVPFATQNVLLAKLAPMRRLVVVR